MTSSIVYIMLIVFGGLLLSTLLGLALSMKENENELINDVAESKGHLGRNQTRLSEIGAKAADNYRRAKENA